jgi:hypothetical protein
MTFKFLAEVCGELCSNNPTGLPKVQAGNSQITAVLQIVFGIIGVIALVIIIIAGLKLVASAGGNPEAAKKARETIIFAALGLVIAIAAELIVTFVLNKL